MKRLHRQLFRQILLILLMSVGLIAHAETNQIPQIQPPTAPASNIKNVKVGNGVQVLSPGSAFVEATSVAFGPGEHASCPNGRLLFGSGDRVAATTLAGTLEVLTNGNPWQPTYKETYPPVIIYDNHITKLKNGDILHTYEGVTWNDNIAHPTWWDKTAEYPLKKKALPGGRGKIYMYRSSDCGNTWDQLPGIDAATLAVPTSPGVSIVGLCGTPRLKRDANNAKYSEAGGWDGHFFYADPYSGALFISTICSYGSSTEGEEFTRALLIVSRDNGTTWSVLGTKMAQWMFRSPISSNKAGKAAFAFFKNSTTLKIVTFDVAATTVDFDAAGAEISFSPWTCPNTLSCDKGYGWALAGLAGDNSNPAQFYASMFSEQSGMLVSRMYRVSGTQATLIAPSLEPANGGAITHNTLINSLPNDPVTAYYWLDIDPTAPNTHRMRFQVYGGGEPLLNDPAVLSVKNGLPYSWSHQTPFIGEYSTGSVYRDAQGNPVFVAVWSENGDLHFNTISVQPATNRPWVAGWHGDGLIYAASTVGANGYKLAHLNAHVLQGDQVRYNAVWQPSSEARQFIAGWTLADFQQRNTTLQSQGYRLVDLTAFVLSGDQVRYNAVWQQSSDTRPFIAGWTLADFQQQNTTLQSQGYKLMALNSFVLSGDQVRYNAVWQQSSDTRPFIAGWTLADFLQQDTTLQSQGYELVDANAFVLSGDQVRYNALWKKPSVPREGIIGWTRNDLVGYTDQIRTQNYEVASLNGFVLSGNEVRYNLISQKIYKGYIPLAVR